MKALDSVRHVRSHSHYDGWKAFKAIAVESPLIIAAASIIYGGMVNHGTPQEAIVNSLTVGLACASAWLAQTTVEIRKKLDFMKDSFEAAAKWNFSDDDKKHTAPLKLALEKSRDTFHDIFNFRKYPIRNSLASFFAIAAIAKPEHAAFMAYSGMLCMTMGIALKEQEETWNIDTAAAKARENIENAEEQNRIAKLKREIIELLGPDNL